MLSVKNIIGFGRALVLAFAASACSPTGDGENRVDLGGSHSVAMPKGLHLNLTSNDLDFVFAEVMEGDVLVADIYLGNWPQFPSICTGQSHVHSEKIDSVTIVECTMGNEAVIEIKKRNEAPLEWAQYAVVRAIPVLPTRGRDFLMNMLTSIDPH